jgi:hypothetical protein
MNMLSSLVPCTRMLTYSCPSKRLHALNIFEEPNHRVFLLDSEDDISKTQMYDDWTVEKAQDMMTRREANHGAIAPGEPLCHLLVDPKTRQASVRIAAGPNGQLYGARFILFKLVSPMPDNSQAGNIDTEFIGVRGLVGESVSSAEPAALTLDTGLGLLKTLLNYTFDSTAAVLLPSRATSGVASDVTISATCLELLAVSQSSLLSRMVSIQSFQEMPCQLLCAYIQCLVDKVAALLPLVQQTTFSPADLLNALKNSFFGRLLPSLLLTLGFCPEDLAMFVQFRMWLPGLLSTIQSISRACGIQDLDKILAQERLAQTALAEFVRGHSVRADKAAAWTCEFCQAALDPDAEAAMAVEDNDEDDRSDGASGSGGDGSGSDSDAGDKKQQTESDETASTAVAAVLTPEQVAQFTAHFTTEHATLVPKAVAQDTSSRWMLVRSLFSHHFKS